MRISDWSSDVCSSDLKAGFNANLSERRRLIPFEEDSMFFLFTTIGQRPGKGRMETKAEGHVFRPAIHDRGRHAKTDALHRKRHVQPEIEGIYTLSFLIRIQPEKTGSIILRRNSKHGENGRASCRERVGQYGLIQGWAEEVKNKKKK